MLHGNYRVWNYHRFRRPGRVDARAIMKYLLGGRDAVNLQRRRWRRRRRRWWCSCSSILFNLPRYREMHSIAISPGVEDSAHLRTLSSPRPPTPFNVRSLVPASCRRRGWGAGRELHPADNTSWTDNEPARLSSYRTNRLPAPRHSPAASPRGCSTLESPARVSGGN